MFEIANNALTNFGLGAAFSVLLLFFCIFLIRYIIKRGEEDMKKIIDAFNKSVETHNDSTKRIASVMKKQGMLISRSIGQLRKEVEGLKSEINNKQ